VPFCSTCNSSVILESGPYAGSLWCFVKRGPRSTEWCCDSWGEISWVERAAKGVSHHVQVNSGVKCHFGTDSAEIETRFFALENGVKSHFETDGGVV